jgi:two-component system, chemotaxis family, protein-glutamate methylesterase/glutaminase
MSTRVLLVDDSPLSQRWLRGLLAADPEFTVAGTAVNGLQALESAQALRPDLVTLDLNMPVMDGLTTLKHLMSSRPTKTVVVSHLASAESHLTFDCLRYGAVDFITKPSGLDAASTADAEEILLRLRRAAAVASSRLRLQRVPAHARAVSGSAGGVVDRLLVVLAGRSGLAPLLQLLSALPRHAGLALVALLDVSPAVATSFAGYASRYSAFASQPAEADVTLAGSTAFLASASQPLLLVAEAGRCAFKPYAPPNGVEREALSAALLTSAAEAFGARLDIVLLSGVAPGYLGAAAELRSRGGQVWAQEPREALENAVLANAVEAGLASAIDRWSGWAESATRGAVAST